VTLLTGSIVWAAAAWATASAVTLVCAALAVGRLEQGEQSARMSLRPDWSIGPLLALARLALPLGIVVLLISLRANVPRYIIDDQLGVRELGIFAGIAYVVVGGDVVMSALAQAATPRLANYYFENDRSAFVSLTLRLCSIGATGGCLGVLGALLIGGPAMRYLYGPEYARHTDVLTLSAAAAGLFFVASFLGAAMTAARWFAVQTPLSAGLFVLGTVASILLIPEFGLRGAAIAMVFVAIAQVAFGTLIVSRVVRSLGEEAAG
jgi:O-antigen/teichoic acid export membrane protein